MLHGVNERARELAIAELTPRAYQQMQAELRRWAQFQSRAYAQLRKEQER